jgi:dipeptidyl aminopeptidase/acylaminoacyl peptidase
MLLVLAGAVLGVAGVRTPAAHASSVSVQNDVTYGEATGVTLTMDVYKPSGDGPFPALVMIHGGVFTHGDKSNLEPDAQFFASNGYACFSINYRLAPQYKFPAGLEDSQAAVEFIRSHADQYNVNPDRIGVLGASAGGTYGDLLATTGSGSRTTGSRILAGVAWSGPTDITAFHAVQRELLGPTATPDQIAQTDPVTFVDPTDAPMMFANGTGEEIPVEQAQRIADAYEQNNIVHDLLISPRSLHAEFLGRTIYPETLDFLNKNLRDAKISGQNPPPTTPSPSESASESPPSTTTTTPPPSTDGGRRGKSSSAPLMIGIVAAIVVLGSAAALAPTLLRRSRRR